MKNAPAAERFTLDTNLLFYALDRTEGAKHLLALDLVDRADPRRAPLLLQSFAELHNAASKKRPSILQEAAIFTQQLGRVFTVVPTTLSDLTLATTLHQRYPLQFFDALLLAIAANAGCTLFLSEDTQHGQTYGPITVRNPFLLSADDLTALAA
jgi:predicted nucleic acid-binding protein